MNLENKLKEFEESCLSLAATESEKLKEEIKEEIEGQMKSELDEYIERKKWSFNKTVEILEKEFMKEIFNYQTECKKEILNAKEDIYEDLKKEVIKKLEDFTKTKSYKKYLFDSIENVLQIIDNKNDIYIGITSKDYKKYKEKIEKEKKINLIEIDNKYIGGCTLRTSEIFIDNTLLNNLEEKMAQEKE